MDTAEGDRGKRTFSWWWVWSLLALSLAVGTVVTVLLWGNTRAEHRDAFDIGWKSAAAVLAILAALVTVERLRLGQYEHQRQLVADEAKRRADQATHITDLSAKASEQLGSDKAAVRIGGLTDLERLARTYPELQQTVVDRICAYLRAPYKPPPDYLAPAQIIVDPENPFEGVSGPELSSEDIASARLELDVRRTAQQILERHLRWPSGDENPPGDFWNISTIDLRDAVLAEVNFNDCRLPSVRFTNAVFCAFSTFEGVVFSADSIFVGARFADEAKFRKANFSGPTGFHQANFEMRADFARSTFCQAAIFEKADFAGAVFDEAVFLGSSMFDEATFNGDSRFNDATFDGPARFNASEFKASVAFDGARFSKEAWFLGPSFFGKTTFRETDFESPPIFSEVLAWIGPHLTHLWPSGWRLEPTTVGARTAVVLPSRITIGKLVSTPSPDGNK